MSHRNCPEPGACVGSDRRWGSGLLVCSATVTKHQTGDLSSGHSISRFRAEVPDGGVHRGRAAQAHPWLQMAASQGHITPASFRLLALLSLSYKDTLCWIRAHPDFMLTWSLCEGLLSKQSYSEVLTPTYGFQGTTCNTEVTPKGGSQGHQYSISLSSFSDLLPDSLRPHHNPLGTEFTDQPGGLVSWAGNKPGAGTWTMPGSHSDSAVHAGMQSWLGSIQSINASHLFNRPTLNTRGGGGGVGLGSSCRGGVCRPGSASEGRLGQLCSWEQLSCQLAGNGKEAACPGVESQGEAAGRLGGRIRSLIQFT